MSNLADHARRELELAGYFDKDGFYGDMLGHAIMKMVEVFAEERHSGMSAPIAIRAFSKVAAFEPLTPLTGADDEWNEVGSGTFQNRRCSHVFKEGNESYDIQGKVFRYPDGWAYTSRDSRVPVTFPYTPKTEYVDVPAPTSDDEDHE